MNLQRITIKDIQNEMGVCEKTARKYLNGIRVEYDLVKPKPICYCHMIKYLGLPFDK